MIELLEFYVSGFWVWLGLTIGLALCVSATSNIFSNLWLIFFSRKR